MTPTTKGKIKNGDKVSPKPSQFMFNHPQVLTPKGKNVQDVYAFNTNPVHENEGRFDDDYGFNCVPEIVGEHDLEGVNKIDKMF